MVCVHRAIKLGWEAVWKVCHWGYQASPQGSATDLDLEIWLNEDSAECACSNALDYSWITCENPRKLFQASSIFSTLLYSDIHPGWKWSRSSCIEQTVLITQVWIIQPLNDWMRYKCLRSILANIQEDFGLPLGGFQSQWLVAYYTPDHKMTPELNL